MRHEQGGRNVLGLVFTELTGFIERHHSEDVVDEVLAAIGFEHDGAWTAVGNYPHEEALSVIVRAAEVLGEDPNTMVVAFGRELFGRFKVLYPNFFGDVTTALEFLERVEDHIHIEVRKLYSEARTPRICNAARAIVRKASPSMSTTARIGPWRCWRMA